MTAWTLGQKSPWGPKRKASRGPHACSSGSLQKHADLQARLLSAPLLRACGRGPRRP